MEISFMGFRWLLKQLWLFRFSRSRSSMHRVCMMLSNGVEAGSIEQRALSNSFARKFGYTEFIVEIEGEDQAHD